MKGYKMPNEGKKSGGGGSYAEGKSGKQGSNHGASSGLKMSNEMRADVKKAPSNTNRYPNGLA